MSIRIGIFGYGNLGRGVEAAIAQNADMELVAVFTRRDPSSVKLHTAGVPVLHADKAREMTDKIDVMILCGGSATDLPVQTPEMAKYFNVVDSFDTHARIPEHFACVDAAACESGKVAMISVGWDPGMFSLNRLLGEAILPDSKVYTFWGKGVSQGHSDAIRRVEGVLDGKQYTIPVEAALEAVRARVLCGGRRGRRQGEDRERDQGDAQLFCRLRHHGAFHQRRGAEARSQRHSSRRLCHQKWPNGVRFRA